MVLHIRHSQYIKPLMLTPFYYFSLDNRVRFFYSLINVFNDFPGLNLTLLEAAISITSFV